MRCEIYPASSRISGGGESSEALGFGNSGSSGVRFGAPKHGSRELRRGVIPIAPGISVPTTRSVRIPDQRRVGKTVCRGRFGFYDHPLSSLYFNSLDALVWERRSERGGVLGGRKGLTISGRRRKRKRLQYFELDLLGNPDNLTDEVGAW